MDNQKSRRSINRTYVDIYKQREAFKPPSRKTERIESTRILSSETEKFKMNEVEELELNHQNLTAIPITVVMRYPNLKKLSFASNALTTIADGFCQFPAKDTITHLDFSHNFLIELPQDIGELSNLKKINLAHNQIVRLPITMYKLKKMEWLNLSENPLLPVLKGDLISEGPVWDNEQCFQCAANVRHLMEVLKKLADMIKSKSDFTQGCQDVNQENKTAGSKSFIKEKTLFFSEDGMLPDDFNKNENFSEMNSEKYSETDLKGYGCSDIRKAGIADHSPEHSLKNKSKMGENYSRNFSVWGAVVIGWIWTLFGICVMTFGKVSLLRAARITTTYSLAIFTVMKSLLFFHATFQDVLNLALGYDWFPIIPDRELTWWEKFLEHFGFQC